MDRKLLDILCCPVSKQPLALLADRELKAVNHAITLGNVKRGDGSVQTEALKEGLITRDHRSIYRIDDGIPVMLVEESILTSQIEDFPH